MLSFGLIEENIELSYIHLAVLFFQVGESTKKMMFYFQVELQKYSLDAMLANSDQKILAQDVKSDMDKVLSKMKKARGKSERFHLGKEMKQLRKELRDREKRAMKETLIRWLHCNHRDSGAFLKKDR